MLVTVKERLLRDAEKLHLSVTYNLVIKDFSKTMNGYFVPSSGKLVLFVLDEKGKMRDYSDLLKTFIHELSHCIQYSEKDFVRCKGVMHDAEFWHIYKENLKLLEVS